MPRVGKPGPQKLLGEHEQLVILHNILKRPGIYLCELQDEIFDRFGVLVSVPTICRTRQTMHHH